MKSISIANRSQISIDPIRLLLTAVLLMCVHSALAQKARTVSAGAHPIDGPEPPAMMAEPIVAPLFLQTDQIDSSLTIVNSLLTTSGGTILVRDLEGRTLITKALSFPPHSRTVLYLAQLLTQAGIYAHSGSIALEQDPNTKGPALLAQLSFSVHTGAQPAFAEEEFAMPGMMGPTRLFGVVSETSNLPMIAIMSTSDQLQHIQLACVGLDGSPAASSIALPPRATRLVRACSWTQLHESGLTNISDLSDRDEDKHERMSLGISVSTDAAPGSFYAFGIALDGNATHPQLQPITFADPAMSKSADVAYVGVPIGVNDGVLDGTFAPVITVVNFANQARTTKLEYAPSSASPSQLQELMTLTLPPLSERTVHLNEVAGEGINNSFVLRSSGAPGDIQSHLYSRGVASDLHVELLPRDIRDDHNGGNHPFSIRHGDTSTLLLFNPTNSKQRFQVRVSGAGASWIDLFWLKPMETKALSIGDLISNQIPDHLHHVLPTNTTEGEVQWSTDFAGTGLGRLLQSNPSTGLARSFACQVYYNLCGSSFGPESFEDLFLGGDVGAFYSIQPVFCTEYCSNCCSQTSPVGGTYSFTTNWSGTNSAYTQLISSSNTQVQLKGIAAGNFSFTGAAQAGQCQSPPLGGGGTVLSLQINSADITTDSISVTLAGGQATGQLTIQLVGSPSKQIFQGNVGVGTTSYSFNLASLPIEEFTQISATWTVGTISRTATYNYHFKNLGSYKQTQYNTPSESSCTGVPQSVTIWNSSCAGKNGSVLSGFDFRVTDPATGTGSGHSISYSDVSEEFSCSVGSGDLRSPFTIKGSLGPVNGTTVAVCKTNTDLYVANRRLYIVGEGVKTVTDACPACCKDITHLDNYTTNTACSGIGSLPNAITVILY